MDFKELMETVAKNWPFDEKTYLELKGVNEETKLRFAVKHVLLHLQKSLGQMAEICESADHKGTLDPLDLELHASKFAVNTVRLLGLIGVDAERLDRFVEEWVRSKV